MTWVPSVLSTGVTLLVILLLLYVDRRYGRVVGGGRWFLWLCILSLAVGWIGLILTKSLLLEALASLVITIVCLCDRSRSSHREKWSTLAVPLAYLATNVMYLAGFLLVGPVSSWLSRLTLIPVIFLTVASYRSLRSSRRAKDGTKN